MVIKTVTYESKDPLKLSERFLTFLVREVSWRDRKTGETGVRNQRLPVSFYAESYDGSREEALAFWKDEKAKEEAKKERGRILGQNRSNRLRD